jgi:maltose alpha-D-glucosyltransferase/alpha-amylase
MGDNIYLGDRNGVRTPMQWSADRNAGFSQANPQLLYLPIVIDPEYSANTVNVETQQANSNSLWWWTRRLIALRNNHPAFGHGSIEFLSPANSKVLTFLRKHGAETLLVVANLSRFPQYVELDLAAEAGKVPVELFGSTPFPAIQEAPYVLTLGPHSFYWFQLEAPQDGDAAAAGGELPALSLDEAWPDAFNARKRSGIEGLLPAFLKRQRWFGSKERRIRAVDIQEAVPVPMSGGRAALVLVRVNYTEGSEEIYQLPLVFAAEERAAEVLQRSPLAGLARLTTTSDRRTESGVLYDGLADEEFCRALLRLVTKRRRLKGPRGTVAGIAARGLRGIDADSEALAPRSLGGEQSNNSIVFGEQVLLKLFRRLDEGENPELEIGRYLTEEQGFANSPDVLGHVALRRAKGPESTMAVLHRFAANQGDAWRMTLHELSLFFDRIVTMGPRLREQPDLPGSLFLEPAAQPADPALIGPYIELARLLGQRTAELHLALTAPTDNPAFAPEPFSTLYQRSLSQAFRADAKQSLSLLQRQLKRLDEPTAAFAQRVLNEESAITKRFHAVAGRKLDAVRSRTHGDYHLGQVLYTGRDFVIIDYEGEPMRTISERRIKRSPVRDVAGMVRSFDYAAITALNTVRERHELLDEDMAALEAWATYWQRWTAGLFLRAYVEVAQGSPLVPADMAHLAILLDVFLLEKVLYEMNYELRHRPEWLPVPLRGLLALLEVQP